MVEYTGNMNTRQTVWRIFFAFTFFFVLFTGAARAAEPALELDQFEGKVVVVDFWASWCVPCRRSFPWLNEMHSKYADLGLVVIGVNLDQERGEAEAFLEEFPSDFRIHFDDTKDLAREFDVVAMPSSYLIGRDGELVSKHFGFKVKQQDEYEAAIVAALGE
jgi:cytochrome c biogenesis protein CcmG/thiol:disulfide interchange protein DsbE